MKFIIYRRFVYGSPNAHMTLSRGVIGPIFPNDQPVGLESMFPNGNGRFGKGSEYHLFNLASNALQLHYWRLTNQMSGDNIEIAKEVFEQMNIEHSAVMRRFSAHGGLLNWDTSMPSVWLTAWALRTFNIIWFQDWEDFIYVDPKVRNYFQK